MHDPRPRRAGSALVRQGPGLLCAISRLVLGRDELRSGAGPAIALAGDKADQCKVGPVHSAKADQCKVGPGVAIQGRQRGSKHRAAPQLLSARTMAKGANCALQTHNSPPRAASQSAERACCNGFHNLSSAQRLESFAILSSHHGPNSEKQSGAEKHVLDGVWLFFLS